MDSTGAGLWYLRTLSQKCHIWYSKSFPPCRQTHLKAPQFPGRVPYSSSGLVPATVINYLIKNQFRGEWVCFSFCFWVSFIILWKQPHHILIWEWREINSVTLTAQPTWSTGTVQGPASQDGAAHFQAEMWKQAIKATKTIVHRQQVTLITTTPSSLRLFSQVDKYVNMTVKIQIWPDIF